MIQNYDQLTRYEHWIEIFKKAIEEKEKMRPFWETDIHPLLHQAEMDGMKSKLKELEEDVAKYKEGGNT